MKGRSSRKDGSGYFALGAVEVLDSADQEEQLGSFTSTSIQFRYCNVQ
jgi:hypothetical protein